MSNTLIPTRPIDNYRSELELREDRAIDADYERSAAALAEEEGPAAPVKLAADFPPAQPTADWPIDVPRQPDLPPNDFIASLPIDVPRPEGVIEAPPVPREAPAPSWYDDFVPTAEGALGFLMKATGPLAAPLEGVLGGFAHRPEEGTPIGQAVAEKFGAAIDTGKRRLFNLPPEGGGQPRDVALEAVQNLLPNAHPRFQEHLSKVLGVSDIAVGAGLASVVGKGIESGTRGAAGPIEAGLHEIFGVGLARPVGAVDNAVRAPAPKVPTDEELGVVKAADFVEDGTETFVQNIPPGAGGPTPGRAVDGSPISATNAYVFASASNPNRAIGVPSVQAKVEIRGPAYAGESRSTGANVVYSPQAYPSYAELQAAFEANHLESGAGRAEGLVIVKRGEDPTAADPVDAFAAAREGVPLSELDVYSAKDIKALTNADVDYLRDAGYDGFYLGNHEGTQGAVVFDKAQIKPVQYSGKAKLLEDPEIAAKLEGTQAVDADGIPLMLWHGRQRPIERISTASERGETSSSARYDAAFFSTTPQFANSYTGFRETVGGSLTPVFAKVNKFLDTANDPQSLEDWKEAFMEVNQSRPSPAHIAMAKGSDNWTAVDELGQAGVDYLTAQMGYDAHKMYEDGAEQWALLSPRTQVVPALSKGEELPVPGPLPAALNTSPAWQKAVEELSSADVITIARLAEKGDAEAMQKLDEILESANVKPAIDEKLQAEADAIMSSVDETLGDPLKPSFNVGQLPPSEILDGRADLDQKYTVNINLSKQNSPEDVQTLFVNVSEFFRKELEASRGGSTDAAVNTAAETEKLSDLLHVPVSNLLPHQAKALRIILLSSAENLRGLVLKANAGSKLDKIAAQKAFVVHTMLNEKAVQGAAHAGQLLRSYSLTATANVERMSELKRLYGQIPDGELDPQLYEMFMMAPDAATLARTMATGSKTGLAKMGEFNFQNVAFEIFANNILAAPITHSVNIASNLAVMTMSPTAAFLRSMNATVRSDYIEAVANYSDGMAQIIGVTKGVSDVFRLGLETSGLAKLAYDKGFPGIGRLGATPSQLGIPAGLYSTTVEQQLKHRIITAEKAGLPTLSSRKAAIANGSTEDLGASALGSFIDFSGHVIRIPGSALMGADAAFKTITYRMKINGDAARQAFGAPYRPAARREIYNALKQNPSTDAAVRAVQFADLNTFTNMLGDTASKFHQGIISTPLRFLLPFFRTTTNILKMGVRNSVVGNVFNDLKPLMSPKSTGPERDEAMAKIAMGTLIPAAVVSSLSDNITGGFDMTTPEGRFRAKRQPPYSIRIPGTNEIVSYAKLEPLRMVLGMMVNYRDAIQSMETVNPKTGQPTEAFQQLATVTIAPFTRVLQDAYILGTIGELMSTLEAITVGNPEQAKKKVYSLMTSLSINSFARQDAWQNDPVVRRADGYIDSVKSSLRGWSKDLPAYKTFWGDDQIRPAGLGPDMISPFASLTYEEDALSDLMIKLEVSTPMAPKEFEYKNAVVPLTTQQQADYEVLRGKGIEDAPSMREVLTEIISDPEFKAADPITQRSVLSLQIERMSTNTRNYMMGAYPDLQAKYQDYLEQQLIYQQHARGEKGVPTFVPRTTREPHISELPRGFPTTGPKR